MGNIVSDRKFCVFKNAIKRNEYEHCITNIKVNNEMNVKSITKKRIKISY